MNKPKQKVNQKLIEKDQDLLKSDRKTTRSRYKNISKLDFKKGL